MKRFLITVLLFPVMQLTGQNYWVQSMGSAAADEAMAVSTDNSGNHYITGYYSVSAQFGTSTLNSSGVTDVFLTKTDASGIIQWAVSGGGTGSDRGLDIYADNNGFVYITGFYNGSATFGTTTLTSAGNSQDIFVAKYTQAGVLVWAQSFGGTDTEQGNAISVDPTGHVVVTGQFRGSATFGSTTLNSTIDPSTGNPSVDVFTLRLTPSGAVSWVEQGAAHHTDRGLDVVAGIDGSVYVTGQFSDTITFDLTHNNGFQNAGFLIKYDSTGQEQWFRQITGGLFAIPYGLAINNNQQLFLTGDFGGTLSFSGSTLTLTNTYTNRIFIVSYSSGGTLIWGQADGSDNDLTARDIIADSTTALFISGHFKCVLNEYADQYGQGTFNSVGFWDYYVVAYNQSGARQWMRNAGGKKDDFGHGVSASADGLPVVAGSFDGYMSLPASPGMLGYNTVPMTNVATPNTYCGDTMYNDYVRVNSPGISNAFATTLLNPSREPYDYYHRSGSGCSRGQVPVCIAFGVNQDLGPCSPDTVSVCAGFHSMWAHTFTSMNTPHGSNGPDWTYNWSTGSTDSVTQVNSSGSYNVTITSADGCFTSSDTIYVDMLPGPVKPCISDNILPTTDTTDNYTINLCDVDSVLAWGGCDSTATSSWWMTPTGQQIVDTVILSANGQYTYVVQDSAGCQNSTFVLFLPDTLLILPPIGAAPVPFPNDSVSVCQGDVFPFFVSDTVGLFGGLPQPPASMVIDYCISYNGGTPICNSSPYNSIPILASSSGSVDITFTLIGMFNNSCGSDTVTSDSTYSFYLNVLPVPAANVLLTGPSQLCPGSADTLFANGTGNYTWVGPPHIALNDSTILVSVPGNYFVYTNTSLPNGCTNSHNAFKSVTIKPTPIVSTNPANGVICPNDSVQLTTTTLGTYEWYGPNGLIGTTNSVYADVPGFYYVVVTDADSCILVSNTIELKQFTTPFLQTFPVPFVCNGDSVRIEIVGTEGVTFNWFPPLSGTSVFHYVDQPGVYSVSVQGCGMADTLSVTINTSSTVATITPSDSVFICPGDSVVLVANPNMPGYSWSPSGTDDSLLVTTPGIYYVTVTDSMNCWDISDSVYVIHHITPLPVLSDTTICYGTGATLTASGSGIFDWYTSPVATTPVFTGASMTVPPLFNDTAFYVEHTDSLCTSQRAIVQVAIDSASMPFTASSNSPLCEGTTLFLSGPQFNGATYSWTGPGGYSSTLPNPAINDIQVLQSGNYVLQISSALCTGSTDTVAVSVIPLPVVSASASTPICEGDTLFLDGNNLPLASYAWTGPLGFFANNEDTFITGTFPPMSGNYILGVTLNGCTNFDTVSVLIKPKPLLPVPTVNSPVCEFDQANFNVPAVTGGSYTWSGPNSFGSALQNPVINPVTMNDDGTYGVVVTVDGCPSDTGYVQLVVIDVPDSIPVTYNTPLCEGDNLTLTATAPAGSTFSWNGPGGFSSTDPSPVINGVLAGNSGIYTVLVNVNGCPAPPGQVNVFVQPTPAAPVAASNSPVCIGDTITLTATHPNSGTYSWSGPSGFSSTLQNPVNPANNATSGNYVVVFTFNGCPSPPDTVNVNVLPSPVDPNPRILGSPCEGGSITLFADSSSGASYFWSGPNGFTSNNAVNQLFPATSTFNGTYYLTATLATCSKGPFGVSVVVHPNPHIDLGPDTSVCQQEPYILGGPAGFSTYLWQDGSTDPLYAVSSTGQYFLVVTDSNGCSASDNVNIQYAGCDELIVPNVFTPNGDGENDLFRVYAEGASSLRVVIFNRWGQVLYEWADPNGGWNGIIQNSDRLAPEGVYYWRAEMTGYNGFNRSAQGFFHLFR